MNTHCSRRTLFALRKSLQLGVLIWLAAGCAGNNTVDKKEISPKPSARDFIEMTLVEDQATVAVPDDLRATMRSQATGLIERQTKIVDEQVKRLQALGKLTTLKPRKLVLHYKVVGFDPGTPMLRQFLGMFGVGAGTLKVDFQFLDSKGKPEGTTQIVVELADKQHLLQSDTELFSAMFIQAAAGYYDKQYRVEFEQYNK